MVLQWRCKVSKDAGWGYWQIRGVRQPETENGST
jgi:hypothetical protein